MSRFEIETLEKALGKLPQKLQEIVLQLDTDERIQQIAKKYDLHVDQAGALINEIGLTILGVELSDTFIDRVKDTVRIPDDVAQNIKKEVNEQIFLPIREEMQKVDEGAAAEPKGVPQEGEEAEQPAERSSITGKPMEADAEKDGVEESGAQPQRMDEYLSRKSGMQEEGTAAQAAPAEQKTQNIPENLPTGAPHETEEKAESGEKNGFLEEKFGGATYSDRESVTVEDETGETKKPYSESDPYREPID